ncbi:hypothetical protein [Plantibacter sp. RU18]|uniref:hypothetical protein n=1 Tax=Plantibacter sp. RU18 TaxID=3158143 RepID=UPI003D3644FD
MTIAQHRIRPSVTQVEASRRLQFADGALGAAGHAVTDPTLRDLGARVARGEMTVEDALAASLEHIDAR